MNHTQRLFTFVGAALCILGLFTAESFAQADYVEPGTGRMKALITYKAQGLQRLSVRLGEPRSDGVVWAIAE